MQLFDWLNKNADGDKYMTMLECSMNDLPIIILVVALCFGICVIYGLISYHNYKISKKYPDSDTKKYLLYFTGVFVFCLLSGYGFRILSTWYNSYKLLAILLAVLLVLSFQFYRYMRKTNAVEKLYEADIWYKEKIEELEGKIKVIKEMSEGLAGKTISLVRFSQMLLLPMDEEIEFTKGVTGTKIKQSENEVVFYCEMLDGTSYGKHYHDCREEIQMISGALIEDGIEYVKGGETRVYNPFEAHEPSCKGLTKFNVIFSR